MMAAMSRDLPAGTVTFLFTDVEGSTRLLERLGSAAYAEQLAEHRRVVRAACSARGGVEVDTQGDAFFLAFPTAVGALDAARAITGELASGPLRLRIGVHTGTPLVTDEGYVGPDVHRAARIAAAGHGGQVLVSSSTAALVDVELRDLGEHRFKDLSAPERVYQLGSQDFPALTSLHGANLPVPATPFLGRERELSEVTALLGADDVRLLTLTGPGGTGKTRLALQAAAEAAQRFRDGIVWVPLAPLRDPSLVLSAVAEAVDVQEEPSRPLAETLALALAGKELLFVLDNVEHLLPDAALELARLAALTGPVLLVTSRERLQIQGELHYPVPTLAERDGIELFLSRALAVAPGLGGDGAVAELCARLDNLPLALELAAARTVVFSPEQLLERLSQRLDLLKGARDADPRQQTLRATIEWSHDLLAPEEQRVFRALSVFAGGCTYDAAEEVCGVDADTVQSLLDKSLLRRRESSAGPRYWMLETIRQFAAERLAANGEADAIRRAHALWFVEAAERLSPHQAHGEEMAHRLERLDLERDNLRAAFAWALDSAPAEAARVSLALREYWYVRDAVTEAADCYAAVLERAAGLDPVAVGRVRVADGANAFFRADLGTAEAQLTEAVELVSGLPDEVDALRALGYVSEVRRDYRLALELHERALALARELGDRYQTRRSLHALGGAYAGAGDLDAARAYGEEAVALGLVDGDDLFLAHAAHNLGDFALRRGDLGEAKARYRQAAAAGQRVSSAKTIAYCLAGLAAVAARRGEWERAARLWGAVEAYEDAVGLPLLSHERELYESVLHELVPGHREAYEEGRALSLDDALEEVSGGG